MSVVLTSANNFTQLLKENDKDLQVLALQKLLNVVDSLWPEISESLPEIESLYEDESFQKRDLAAFLASKVYYHLEDYDEALNYALLSKDYFNIYQRSQYVDCLVSKCVEKYVDSQQKNYTLQQQDNLAELDEQGEQYKDVVEKMMNKCIEEKDFKLVLGIAIETRRLDKIKEILAAANETTSDVLTYLCDLSLNYLNERTFRLEVMNFVVESYQKKTLEPSEYANLCQCYFYLDKHEEISQLLYKLISLEDTENNNKNVLLAYQIAQDLSENESVSFMTKLVSSLPSVKSEEMSEIDQTYENTIKPRLIQILDGSLYSDLTSKFLKLNNKTDTQLITNIKTAIDQKNSVAHSAVLFANSIYQSGTTNDNFLREHFEWIARSSHWAKFNLVSSLGVIHQNNHSNAMELLKPYFTGDSSKPNYYAHGGGLYALGLIHQRSKDQTVIDFLLDNIKNPSNNQNEQIIHGACLGLGLVGLGSGDENLYEELKNILFTNSATTGEAAGMAIGLLMAGSANQLVFEELFAYAKETQHEKIIRAICMCLAMLMFGKEEFADEYIEQMCSETDPILRFGGVYMIALAYAGTAHNKAIKKLLHFASSDVSDDVRRAAVISLSFVLINNHKQVPKIMNLLVMSYNPHVRYGAAMALGIACAGKFNNEAITMLEPMLNDTIDFVRQGAMIGMSLVLQQSTETLDSRTESLRKQLKEIYSKKHEDILCRLGAIISSGLLDAGGRNQTLQLVSKSGSLKMGAVLGTLFFTHYWYWFSSIHFLSLGLAPSMLMGVNADLKAPKSFQFKSNAKPSMFRYPSPLKTNDKDKNDKPVIVQLSTTAKAKFKAANKEKEEDKQKPKDEMEIEEKVEVGEEVKEEEANFEILNNPSRVLEKQQNYISMVQNRYKPVIKNRTKGLVFLVDSEPETQDEYFGEEAPVKQDENMPVIEEEAEENKDSNNVVNPPDDFILDETK